MTAKILVTGDYWSSEFKDLIGGSLASTTLVTLDKFLYLAEPDLSVTVPTPSSSNFFECLPFKILGIKALDISRGAKNSIIFTWPIQFDSLGNKYWLGEICKFRCLLTPMKCDKITHHSLGWGNAKITNLLRQVEFGCSLLIVI